MTADDRRRSQTAATVVSCKVQYSVRTLGSQPSGLGEVRPPTAAAAEAVEGFLKDGGDVDRRVDGSGEDDTKLAVGFVRQQGDHGWPRADLDSEHLDLLNAAAFESSRGDPVLYGKLCGFVVQEFRFEVFEPFTHLLVFVP